MPRHITLPGPHPVGSRRTLPAPTGGPPPRDRPDHGAALKNQLESVRAIRANVSTGVDPRFVFKVRAASRLTETNFENKGLHLLGEGDGWQYFVLPADDDASEFQSSIEAYVQTEDGRSFFDLIDQLEPYGREDRSGFGIPYDLQELSYPCVIDIHLWPASSGVEARSRLREARETAGMDELGADEQPAFLVIRARVSREALDALLDLTVVESIRLPPEPFLSPTDWAGSLAVNFVQPQSRDGVVGVIDDGVHTGHTLLHGLVESFNVPDSRVWAPNGPHGTMVAGLVVRR